MIAEKVALVLGAGASKEFGFPLGWELTKSMCEFEAKPDGDFYNKLLSCNFPAERIHGFRRALLYSAANSVDAFLEHRTDYLDIGKAAIAYRLIPHEQMAALFSADDSNWYRYLFGKLNCPFDSFGKNPLSILTFNYDRSLEQFLLTALMNKYNKPREECIAALQPINIIHLYGKLGDLPGMGKNEFEYKADYSDQRVLNGAKGIRIIHEDPLTEEFKQAGRLLDEADRICFLGFGYGEVNLTRLVQFSTRRNQRIYGSAVGLSRHECVENELQLRRLGFDPGNSLREAHIYNSVVEYLRNIGPFG